MHQGTRLGLYVFAFVALTALGLGWTLHRHSLEFGALARLAELGIPATTLVLVLVLAMYVADVWRYQVLAAALGERVPFLTGLQTSVANDFFSWITPGAALGAPAATFILKQNGLSLDVATVVCFGKSMLGAAVVLGSAFVALALGVGPELGPAMRLVLLSGTGVVAGIVLVPLLASAHQPRLGRLRAQIDAYAEARLSARAAGRLRGVTAFGVQTVARVGLLRARGPRWTAAIVAVHVPYVVCFSGVIFILLTQFGVTQHVLAFGSALVYVAFTYVAPTPGGAGLSEATAVEFLGHLVDPSTALATVLLFRASTLYLHLSVGAVYVFFRATILTILQRAP